MLRFFTLEVKKTGKPNKNSIQSWVVFCFPLPLFFLHLHSVHVWTRNSEPSLRRRCLTFYDSCLLPECLTALLASCLCVGHPSNTHNFLTLKGKQNSLSISFPLEIPSLFLLRKVLGGRNRACPVSDAHLCGASFSLLLDKIRDQRRSDGWVFEKAQHYTALYRYVVSLLSR